MASNLTNFSCSLIQQTLEASTVPIDLSTVNWPSHMFFLLVVFICMMVICNYNYSRDKTVRKTLYNDLSQGWEFPNRKRNIMKYLSPPDTATEVIYESFNYNENLIHLTCVEFCGYKNTPQLEPIMALKYNYEQTLKTDHIGYKIRAISLSFQLLMIIFIASLLVATYCDIVYISQNDEYQRRYSIPFSCYYMGDPSYLCLIYRHISSELEQHNKNQSYPKLEKYDDFYTDLFYPYLQQQDPSFQVKNNDTQLCVFVTQDLNECLDLNIHEDKLRGNNSNTMDGYLYLSANGLEESNIKFVCLQTVGNMEDVHYTDAYTVGKKCWCICCSCPGSVGGAIIALMVLMLLICVVIAMWPGTWVAGTSMFTISFVDELRDELQEIVNEISDIDNQWIV
eukprot:14886_1